jgi:hypothetical protein
LTASYGFRDKLWFQLVEENTAPYWDGETDQDGVTLNCYYVCSFTASESREGIRSKVANLLKLCTRATANIGSRRVEEHIYDWHNDSVSIVAGCGSATHFRNNLYKRLAEAFFNFKWILEAEPDKFRLEEFKIYEKFFIALTEIELPTMLALANTPYIQARRLVDQLTGQTFLPS